jgi:uncharacterized iron-regulated protein
MRLFRVLASFSLISVSALFAADSLYELSIGDPSRRETKAAVQVDAITDTRSGELLAPQQLIQRLASARLVFVGETHDSMDIHRVQLRIIEGLHRAGREVLVGLEMFPYTEQQFLDQWSKGLLTEDGFIELARWYDNWGMQWDYYRDIFLFARDKGIRMHGINTPREVIRAVREKGFENLTESEAEHTPPEIDTDSDEHRKLFRAIFAEDDDDFHAMLSDEQLEAMFDAQCTWDATMGYNAVRTLEAGGGPDAVMVVLIGSGHLAYELGIQRQVSGWFEGTMATVIPIPVRDEDGETVEAVQASYADYLWGVPPATQPLYPSLGLSTTLVKETGRRRVIHVAKDTPAERAGFQLGDVLLTIDGVEIENKEIANRELARRRWGDSAEYVVQRDDEKVTLTVHFRRHFDVEEAD